MARRSTTDRLDDLRRQRAVIDAQLRALEARKKQTERKADTRRKVIAGALALEHFTANRNSEFARILFRLLDEYVVRPHDRGLFDFLSVPDLLTPTTEFGNAGRETAASTTNTASHSPIQR